MRGVVAPLLWGATRVRPRFVRPLGMSLVLSVVPGASRPAYCLPWAARSWPGREVPLDGGTAPQGYLKAGLRSFRAGACGSGTGTHAQRHRRCAIAGSTVSRSL